MKSNRDEFTSTTKQRMAERVAWRCSFPGCDQNTIGPDSDDETKRVNNGVAAHIYAAAPDGPRYDKNMTSAQRKHISNGIWMCRNHGNLIDADYSEYSGDTLKIWKAKAEKKAAESLKSPTSNGTSEEITLIQIGNNCIYYAQWETIHTHRWSFELIKPEINSIVELKDYILSFGILPETETYIVIESQGDARKIKSIELKKSSHNKDMLHIEVEDKFIPTDPNLLGSDLKLGEDGDIFLENGSFAMVRGIETAKQMLSICMSTIKGEVSGLEELGSLSTYYYNNYKENLELLSRLIKLEFIRLSLIPVKVNSSLDTRPSLYFVKRFVRVDIFSNELIHRRLKANVKLEWGNGDLWEGEIPIFVLQV